mgnify:CR=1 FL=1
MSEEQAQRGVGRSDVSLILTAQDKLREACRNSMPPDEVSAVATDMMLRLSMPGQLQNVDAVAFYSVMHSVFNEGNIEVIKDRLSELLSGKVSRLNLSQVAVRRLINAVAEAAARVSSLSQLPDVYLTCMDVLTSEIPEVDLASSGHKGSIVNYTYSLACSTCVDVMLSILINIFELTAVLGS